MNLNEYFRNKIELILNWIAFIAALIGFVGLYQGLYENDYRLLFYCIGTYILVLVLYKLIQEDE